MTDYGILAPAWAATGAADLVDDNALLTAMLATEVALAEAQAELGVIPAGAAVAIRAAAAPAHIDLAVLAAGVRETANPVVAFVEQLTASVRSVDASAAEYVHRGSTSQDILDTALTLLCGFLVLSTCLVTTIDGIIRRWVDVFWTASARLRAMPTENIRYVYFVVLVAYA